MRKRSRHLISASLSFVFVLTSACAMFPPTGERTEKGVIFSAEQTAIQGRHFFELPAPYWTPSAADVAQLESKLEGYLRSSTVPRVDEVVAELDHSKRQYLGYTEAGRKRVFVNGLCERAWITRTWQTHLVVVLDGGSCFFQLHYDLDTAIFDGVFINGEA